MKNLFYITAVLVALFISMPITTGAADKDSCDGDKDSQVNHRDNNDKDKDKNKDSHAIHCDNFIYLHTEAGMVVDFVVNGNGKWILYGLDCTTGQRNFVAQGESNMSKKNNEVILLVPYSQSIKCGLYLVLLDGKGWSEEVNTTK
jgi:hypothetical protein